MEGKVRSNKTKNGGKKTPPCPDHPF